MTIQLVLPMLVFVACFGAAVVVMRRPARTVSRLQRHEMVGVGGGAAVAALPRTRILGGDRDGGSLGALAARAVRGEMRIKAGRLLAQAGSPMPLGTFLLLRVVCLLVFAPVAVYYILDTFGLSLTGMFAAAIGGSIVAYFPQVSVKRKARKRTKAINQAMPDALDLLVVCVEGGLSLDGGFQQVAQRTDGLLAEELRRLLSEVGSGMSRRDALHALTGRSQSEDLSVFCSTIVQAEKMGMSVGTTLRTLAETMRNRRRQAAETQARKAPIKMLPCLVFFMIPSLFIVILTPAAVGIMEFFGDL